MRTFLVSASYLAIGAAAWRWTYSNSGWVVLGLVPVLWLDRHVFRLLHWQMKPLRSACELRLGYLLAGTALVLLAGWPRVELAEAAFCGLVLSLATFLLELVFGWFVGPAPGFRRLASRVAFLILVLVFLSPLLNFHPIRRAPVYTPQDVGLAYEDVVLETEDGLKLRAWLVPHPEPRGSIIICHGLTGNREQFLYVLPWLHDLGLTVLAFDFRGHGQSSGHTITFGAREASDLVAAEAYLARRCPDRPMLLYGVSYGAAVALQAPPRLRHVEGAWVESSFNRFTDASEVHFGWLPPWPRRGLIRVYSVLVWLDTGVWPPALSPVDCVAERKVPVCFCHGCEDALIPLVEGQELYEAYSGPKRYYWIKDAKHGDVPDEEVVEYYRRLREFFEERLAAAGR